jgi:hypothetical protein
VNIAPFSAGVALHSGSGVASAAAAGWADGVTDGCATCVAAAAM